MADTDVTRIAGNIGAMNALYALNNINKQLSIHQTRLATGKRINSAADDPAGLAISTKMLSRSLSLKTALSNIGDAKNLLAVAESGLGRLTDILNSMRTITEQAASDTLGTEERNIVKEQLASYAQQINDIVDQTKWSDKKLIDGSYESASLTFQTGADVNETTLLTGLVDMKASALSLLTEATEAVTAAVSTSTIGTNLTAATSAVTGTQIATGTYTVETAFQSDGSYVISLVNASSAVVATAAGTYEDATAESIDFGNGLSVTMAASGIYTAGEAAVMTASNETDLTMATSAVTGTELATGTYAVSVVIATDGSYVATLTDSLSAVVATMNGAAGAYTSAAVAIDFGTGITATLDASIDITAGATATADVDYTASTADAYSLADSDAFGYTASAAATTGGVNIGTAEDAAAFSAYMTIIDNAMVSVNSQLSKIGSLTGSLTFKEDQVSSSQINVEASYNRIMNANMAEEQVNASKLLILQQTSTAMLAQANAAPQFLLSLFQ
jgi:flagellin